MNRQPLKDGAGEAFAHAAGIMAHLRGPEGCPWDREQTFDTIKPFTLEETYEVFDAIERRDWNHLKDELGDLLLQVLFYAQMANEEGHFDITDVLTNLSEKLVRRHPHVFGEEKAESASDVLRTWEQVKLKEKKQAVEQPAAYLDSVPRSMPALLEATKLGSRAAKTGFDWSQTIELFDKLEEEQRELRDEVEAEIQDQQAIAEEFGDLLFVAVNLARHLKLSPEEALRAANAKFRHRFGAMEQRAGSMDAFTELPLEEKELLWLRAKQDERA